MLFSDSAVRTLDTEHKRQLSGIARRNNSNHKVRIAVGSALVAFGRRLAPEAPESQVLRNRAGPEQAAQPC